MCMKSKDFTCLKFTNEDTIMNEASKYYLKVLFLGFILNLFEN